MKLWDAVTWLELISLEWAPSGGVRGLVFLADGTGLAALDASSLFI